MSKTKYERFKFYLGLIIMVVSAVNILLSINFLPETRNSLMTHSVIFLMGLIFFIVFRKEKDKVKNLKKK